MARPMVVASGFVTLLASAPVVLAQTGKPIFDAPQYPVDGEVRAIVVADFNGDGFSDCATADQLADEVAVLLGNGRGAFAPAVNYPVLGDSPRSLAKGDFNSDGRIDLVTSNWVSHDVSVLFGDATYGFVYAGTYYVGVNPRWAVAGNFNGDAHPDLAVANLGTHDISLLFNTGTGGFAAAMSLPMSGETRKLAVGDFNGDNVDDIAAISYQPSQLSVLLGNGLGGFTTTNSWGLNFLLHSLAAADVSGDGHLDLVVGGDQAFTVLLGNGAGGFGAPMGRATYTNETAVAIGDADHDGKPDIVFAEGDTGTVQIIPGVGNGTFGNGASVVAAGGPADVAIGEFNGDGWADLAVADLRYGVSLLLSGGPKYGVAPSVSLAVAPSGFELRDLDFDGDLDAASSGLSGLDVALNDGHGRFWPISNAAAPAWSLAMGSLNGDVYLDAVVLDALAGNVRVHFGAAGATFGMTTNIALGTNPSMLVLGDVNNDGKQDLVATNLNSGVLSCALGDGAGKFAPAITSLGTLRNWLIALARMDGDAKLDAITADSTNGTTGALTIHHGDGAGGFVVSSTTPLAGSPMSLATGDFNGDGHVDAAVTNWSPASLQVLFGDGAGNFQAFSPVLSIPSLSDSRVAGGDVNSDGALDLVTANRSGNSVAIYFGDGHGGFAEALSFTGMSEPNWLAVADVDGDGATDITTLGSSGFLTALLHADEVIIQNYCTAGTTTHGCNALISGIGVPSASAASGFELRVAGVEGQKQGTLFYGINGRVAWPWGLGGTSYMCVASPVQRMLVTNSGGTWNACDGSFSLDFNAYRAASPLALGQPMTVGQDLQAQAWFRDPPAPKSTNLSDAVEFQLLP